MFTMHEVEIFVDSAKLVFIFGFVFCMVLMVTNHLFRLKAINGNDANAERFLALRKQLAVGLGLLLLCLFVSFMFMNFLHNWNDSNFNTVTVSSDPHLMREATNKVMDAIKLLLIFCSASIGAKLIFNYREQVAKLRNTTQGTIPLSGPK